MIRRTAFLTALVLTIAAPGSAAAFGLKFDWGNIPLCTSGQPGTVQSPTFTLTDIPKGTESLRFRLIDENAPGFDHGGGTVRVPRGDTILSGAFTYKSPCPPDGPHTYSWTVTALDPGGKLLGVAAAAKRYP